MESSNYQVRAVSRALRILQAFTPERPVHNLSDLSRSLGLHKSTMLRLLSSLEAERFIEKTKDGYRLGTKVFELGSAYYVTSLSVAQIARGYMPRLVDEWQLSANLAVLDHDEVLYVEVLEPSQPLRVKFSVGSRAGIHCTALGKVLTSEMPWAHVENVLKTKGMPRYTASTITTPERFRECLAAVRSEGYALDQEEIIEGVRCVAAPIRDRTGRIVSALSLSGPLSVFSDRILNDVISDLKRVTSEISSRVG
ncbi:MAG: IclR family transcriptional regulator [Bacillota bacterium]